MSKSSSSSRNLSWWLINRGPYLPPVVFLILVFLYSRDDLVTAVVLLLSAFMYIHAYVEVIEKRLLKGGVMQGHNPNSRSYNAIIVLSKLLFFFLFVAIEAVFLVQWFPFNPESLGLLYLLIAQALLVTTFFNLSEEITNMLVRDDSSIRHVFIDALAYTLVPALAILFFIIGLYTIGSGFMREVATDVFITMMLASLLNIFISLVGKVSKAFQG